MNIERKDERILIKYADENFYTYKCIIRDDDVFVVNFCKRNLEKMEKILRCGFIVELDGHYILKIEEPVCLEYVLHKEKLWDAENYSTIIDKFHRLEQENAFYKRKVFELEQSVKSILNVLQLVNEQIEANNSVTKNFSERIKKLEKTDKEQ